MWKEEVRDLKHFVDLCGVFPGMWIFVVFRFNDNKGGLEGLVKSEWKLEVLF